MLSFCGRSKSTFCFLLELKSKLIRKVVKIFILSEQGLDFITCFFKPLYQLLFSHGCWAVIIVTPRAAIAYCVKSAQFMKWQEYQLLYREEVAKEVRAFDLLVVFFTQLISFSMQLLILGS